MVMMPYKPTDSEILAYFILSRSGQISITAQPDYAYAGQYIIQLAQRIQAERTTIQPPNHQTTQQP